MNFLQPLFERLYTSANVRTIFGDPIVVEDKTVVPVAKIGLGLGGGAGKGEGENDSPCEGEGAGGGGGVGVVPVGVVEITADGTRFIPIAGRKKWIVALCAGFLLGLIWGRRK